MWSISMNVIKFEFLNYAAFGFHSLLNIMRDFECDRDVCWTWLIFDVLNVNVWNVHVECDVWPWIWSRCLLNLINFHVLNANVVVECDRYRWMWSNLNSWILHHLAFHNRKRKAQQCLLMTERLLCSCDGFCGTGEQEAGAHVTCRLANGNLERIRRLFSNL